MRPASTKSPITWRAVWACAALAALSCSLDVGAPEAPAFDADLTGEVVRLLGELRSAPPRGEVARFAVPSAVVVAQGACAPLVTGDTLRNAEQVPVDLLQTWPAGCARPTAGIRSMQGTVRTQDLGGRFAARVTHALRGIVASGNADLLLELDGTVDVRAVDATTGDAVVQRRFTELYTEGAATSRRTRRAALTYRWVDLNGVPRHALTSIPTRFNVTGTLTVVRTTPSPDSVTITIGTVDPLVGDAGCAAGFRSGEVELVVSGTRSGSASLRMTC